MQGLVRYFERSRERWSPVQTKVLTVVVPAVSDAAATCAGTLAARTSGPRGASSNLAVYALAVSPATGDVLFAGGADYRVHMYDLRSRALLHTLSGHASTVRALCFTPDGSKLCSSGGDFNLLVWRVPSGADDGGAASRAAADEDAAAAPDALAPAPAPER